MKRVSEIILIIIVTIVLFASILFLIINNKSKDTKVIISSGTAEYLYSLKTPYIGDNSAVGALLDALDLRNYGHYTFALKTGEKPYVLTINYSIVEGWGNILDKPDLVTEKSALLLALIENADEINWVLPENDEVTKITSDDLLSEYGNIKDYGKTSNDLKRLLINLGYYNEEEPIVMSVTNLTNKGLTLTLKNSTNNNYLYGAYYTLEYKKDDKWYNVEFINECAFNSIGYTLSKEEIKEDIDWEFCNGKLKSGLYRITKSFDDITNSSDVEFKFGKKYIISVEFEI